MLGAADLVGDIWNTDLKHWLEERSSSLGFSLTGITSVADPHNPDDPAHAEDAARFEAWIDAGRAGEMDYLKRRDASGLLLRTSARLSQPWANSVVVCALKYAAPGPLSVEPAPETSGWIARYAWSGKPPNPAASEQQLAPTDYHDFLLARVRQLAEELEARVGGQTRCYVDTGPVVERSLAARAGVGWIGKNTCVLNQGEGSWLLLAVILTSLRLPPAIAAIPAPDRCGSCTRCLDACPTAALTAPHQMDASRCIAYLTIEKKGAIPTDLRSLMGRQVFGCDICQDVCPWNRRAAPSPIPIRPELINPDLEWLAAMDAPTFKQWFKGSPLERTRRSRLHRNIAIAMGNSAQPGFLPRLHLWAAGDDPILAEAATWAIARIGSLHPNEPPTHDASPSPTQPKDTPQTALC